MEFDLDERTKQDFLVYANSVIKSRAIPSVEDNLKPIHRKILWTMYEDKLFSDKKTTKCASVVGDALHYSPHGDASVYGALVRLSQWWKLRYPLVVMQGNGGNILGDGAAASRYTECKLSKIGEWMLEDLDKNSVDMHLNYSGEQLEPNYLPSRFPWLLCGNNSGIAVGMSSDIVSHNFSEVCDGIKYYIDHQECSIADLMKYIKGPDFPTGGKIINGEELLNIYTLGKGAIKIAAHYDIIKKNNKTVLVFHDLPYGVEIDTGVKAPLKKLVLEEGYEVFEDINVEKISAHNFDISITLAKNADVAKCLEILFTKTRLCESVKINNTVLVNGEPQLLNLKQLIAYWVEYRSGIIQRIARNDYDKTNHKLTVTIGLQKCMSNIDLLISLIRNATNNAAAKVAIMKEFELSDEQATAVLDMKLGRLSKLDLTELNDTQKELEEKIAKLKNIIDNKEVRYSMIKDDLDKIKKEMGKDDRLTEIHYASPVLEINSDKSLIKQEYLIYSDGLHNNLDNTIDNDLIDCVFAYNPGQILGYNKQGEMFPITKLNVDLIGAMVNDKQTKLVAVTKNGNIKVSLSSDYKLNKDGEKIMKIKEEDELIYSALCNDSDYLMLMSADGRVLKLAINDLPVASKTTVGVKSGFAHIIAAAVVNNSDSLLFITNENKGKLTPVKDFTIDKKGNKGQTIVEGTLYMRKFENNRQTFYIVSQQGKVAAVDKSKVSTKSKNAIGALITSRKILRVV